MVRTKVVRKNSKWHHFLKTTGSGQKMVRTKVVLKNAKWRHSETKC